EVALLSYMVSASFIDRFRSEILWWMILFVAAAGNVYYLQYQEHRANHRARKNQSAQVTEALT
ncbi:MAG TPA: hypothetical protein VKY53_05750, partial [Marinobacter sp.]|nr:hypothetical protein [Marinobacter sp.]